MPGCRQTLDERDRQSGAHSTEVPHSDVGVFPARPRKWIRDANVPITWKWKCL